MTDHFEDFPFDQLGIFPSWKAASEAGYPDNQIWSVCEHEETWCYGPPHHHVNHMHHIVTAETHDGETYYHEEPE